jgi:hypothetical protein
MALDDRIALTLYDRMMEVITGKDPGAGLPSAFDTQQTMFVMAQRGMVLNGADYRNPWSPGNTSGSMDATEAIATLVDDIPAVSPMLSWTGRKVSDVYTKMVKLVHVDEPPPSPEVQAARDRNNALLVETGKDDEGRPIQKPTQLAERENAAWQAYQDAYTTYIATWAAAQADPNLKRIWPMTGPTALGKVKRAFSDWGAAGRDQVETAKAQLATLNEGQVARCFADAQLRLNGYQLVNEADGATFLRTKIAPSDWASSDASSWPSFQLSQSDFAREASSEATSWGGSAGVGLGLWRFGGGISHSENRARMSEESTKIGIGFRWRICPIYRPWLDATLFRLPRWNLGTMTAPIAGPGDALMPLIPISLVIVRDVEITGTWSKQDSAHIDTATSGSVSAGWGPFSVSGNYSHRSTNDRFSAKRTQQGFTIPDIQIVGLVCSRVPPCPPSR